MSNGQYVKFLVSFSYLVPVNQLDQLDFCGESSRTMRAGCYAFRYFPNPLGIVTAKQLAKLEFGGQCPLTMRARCSVFRYFPNPLGVVTAEQLDKLEFV